MPPPKKPKIGTSRVAEFLSQRELDEINSSLSSGSPQSCADSDAGERVSTPSEGRKYESDARPPTSLANNQDPRAVSQAPRRLSREEESSPVQNIPFDLSSGQTKTNNVSPYNREYKEDGAVTRCSPNGESDRTRLVQSLLTAEEKEKPSDEGLVKHLMERESPSSNILSKLFNAKGSVAALTEKPKQSPPMAQPPSPHGHSPTSTNYRGLKHDPSSQRGGSPAYSPKPGHSGHENRLDPARYVGVSGRENTGPADIKTNTGHSYGPTGELNLKKPPLTEMRDWRLGRSPPPNGPPLPGKSPYEGDSRKNFHHSTDYQPSFVHPQDRHGSPPRHSPGREDKRNMPDASISSSDPVFSEAYMNAVYCMAAMANGRPQKDKPTSESPNEATGLNHGLFNSHGSPSDITASLSKVQQGYINRLPHAIQQEALKIQSSAAAAAVVNAMRGDPVMRQKFDMLPPGDSSRHSPGSQLLPPNLSRHQREILQKRVDGPGPDSWQMEHNSSAGSVQQQRPPSCESSAGDQGNRLAGDSLPESQSSQEGACVPNQSPGPLNSPQEMPSSTMDDRRGRARSLAVEEAKAGGRRCQICDDTASGFHYGVWSCEGCKAFFKRSLQGPVDYVCPATNNCTIDKHRRKSCQACRLRKCLETGMSRGNCRKEKGPRGPNKQKRKLEPEIESPVVHKEPKIKKEIDDVYPQYGVAPQTFPSATVSSDKDRPFIIGEEPAKNPCPIHHFVDHLMRIDPPVRFANHDNQLEDNAVSLMSSLLKLADSELVDIINWAKAIPGYAELTLDDRIHLLESSWMELLMLGLVWRSLPYTDVLVFAPDLPMGKDRCKIADVWPTCQKLFAIVDRCRELKISREEMVLMRITILLNAEMIQLQSNGSIKKILEKTNEAWYYTLVTRHKHSPTRLTELMLLLPHFRQSSMNAVAHIFEIKRSSSVPIYDLLREMLEGQKEVRHDQPGQPPVKTPLQVAAEQFLPNVTS